MMQLNMSSIAIGAMLQKGHYIGPHTQQGALVANNPLDLLCIDFFES